MAKRQLEARRGLDLERCDGWPRSAEGHCIFLLCRHALLASQLHTSARRPFSRLAAVVVVVRAIVSASLKERSRDLLRLVCVKLVLCRARMQQKAPPGLELRFARTPSPWLSATAAAAAIFHSVAAVSLPLFASIANLHVARSTRKHMTAHTAAGFRHTAGDKGAEGAG